MRHFLTALLGAVMALPGVAWAELPTGSYRFADLPIGRLQVVEGEYTQHLTWNGQRIGEETGRIEINGVYTEPGADHYYVLTTHHSGGNGCFPSMMMLRLGPDGMRRTDIFGSCGGVKALRLKDGVFELDQTDARLFVSHMTYAFDGLGLSHWETPTPAPVDVGLGGGADVTRWLGTHPTEALRDPGEQGRFLRIMDMDALDQLRMHASVANEVIRRGDWVLGAGCFPHACNVSNGFWGLRVSTGAPVAVMLETDAAPWQFGNLADLADPVIQQFIAERLPR